MSTEYFGASGSKIRHSGGSVRVTCAANVGQGNGGTSLQCAGCWVSAPSGNTAPTKFNIGTAASATLGAEIAKGVNAMWIPIDDVSQLFFYSGGATDVIDITFLRG
jgi:hypothetical protein